MSRSEIVLQDAIARIKSICAASQGRSQYYPHGGTGYKASVTHYFESSTEVAALAVQPGSESDLARIVRVIADTHVPFAVKCGGHSTNPGFSSTTGIQICLSRLNEISVNLRNKLVRVGAGCLFGELYQELQRFELNIVGGSGLSGVGVSGWMLGGGYSVKTSQYGLGVDNLQEARVVLPDGTIKVASEDENKILFFAIKGGGNNYGIVTEFTLKAHDQPEGTFRDLTFTYKDSQYYDRVKKAIYNITKKGDKKANVEAAFRHYSQAGTDKPLVTLTVHCVYDGEYPSEDPFEEFNSIPRGYDQTMPEELIALPGDYKAGSFLAADIFRSIYNGTYDILSHVPKNSKLEVWTRSARSETTFTDGAVISDVPEFESSKPPMFGIGQFPRGRWGNVVVDEFTEGIIDEIQKQATEVAKELKGHGGSRVTIGLWPFTKDMFNNATRSAFPHEQGKPNCPIIVYFTWEGRENDAFWVDTMKSTLEKLRTKVFADRPQSRYLPLFINTALFEATKVEDLYRNNLAELVELRRKYDPHGVMDLTGGFKIPMWAPTGES